MTYITNKKTHKKTMEDLAKGLEAQLGLETNNITQEAIDSFRKENDIATTGYSQPVGKVQMDVQAPDEVELDDETLKQAQELMFSQIEDAKKRTWNYVEGKRLAKKNRVSKWRAKKKLNKKYTK